MNEEKFEELAMRWPLLFEKAAIEHMGIDDGWYGIIDTLCEAFSYNAEQLQQRIAYYKKECITDPSTENTDRLATAEAEFAKAVAELPIIHNVKEKFGGLRFHASGLTDEQANYIEFAEMLSKKTCEVCGAPGHSNHRELTWIKTLCDDHFKERLAKSKKSYEFTVNPFAVGPGKVPPNIADDD